MIFCHKPVKIEDESLEGLEIFDPAGKIALADGDMVYSKSELAEYWNILGQSTTFYNILFDHKHSLDCIVRVRIGVNGFVLLYHTGNPESLPPSSAMPYVIMLYASDQVTVGGPSVSVFADSDALYSECRVCLEFLIRSIVGNPNNWSLASLARDFIVENVDVANSGYGLLLSDAFSAGKIKYAYLDLFRCIEHKALRYAQEQFVAKFLNDPRGASDEISTTVKSEKHLYTRVISSNSAVISGAGDVIDNIRTSNSYLSAVISRMEAMPSDPNAKSTQILYAVRNSIAHAKAGDLMVERFSDYEFALSQLVPYVEILALRFAGIELDAALA